MEKSAIRRQMMELRAALAPAEREANSAAAQQALIESPPFARAGTVLIYVPFRGEVATERISQAAIAAGKRLALPRVIRQPRGLVLHAYSGDPATLTRGAYGILEPRPEWPVVSPGAIDLVVVPGVAFDRSGGRLGYGGGYYDRLLPEIRTANPGAVLIGLAYGFAVAEQLPRDPHDIPVDGLATERGYLSVTK